MNEVLEKNQFIIYRSNTIMTGLLVFSLVAIFITCKKIYPVTLNIYYLILPVLIILISIGIVIWTLKQFILKNPLLKLNSEYLCTPKTGNIPWADIEHIEMKSFWGIGLAPGIPFSTKISIIIIHLKSGKTVMLNTDFYSKKPVEVYEILMRYYKFRG
jgi:hypothetical protein